MGKRGTFTFRITSDLRTKLETAAAQSMRPVSEEIELRLEQSFLQKELLSLTAGGDATAELIQKMSAALTLVRLYTGKSWRDDAEARRQAISALGVIISKAVMMDSPTWADDLAFRAKDAGPGVAAGLAVMGELDWSDIRAFSEGAWGPPASSEDTAA